MWQGLLALKNDTAAVQLHFVSGNNVLAHRSLPAPEGGPPLRIAQRMRLEASQLEGVARRMMVGAAAFALTSLGWHFCKVLGAPSFGTLGGVGCFQLGEQSVEVSQQQACSKQMFDLSLVDFSFQVESDYCLLLALPCGRDQEDVVNQTESLKAAFISYLQAKQAAGIINVPNPGSNQVQARRVGCRRKLCVDNGPASLAVVVEALH